LSLVLDGGNSALGSPIPSSRRSGTAETEGSVVRPLAGSLGIERSHQELLFELIDGEVREGIHSVGSVGVEVLHRLNVAEVVSEVTQALRVLTRAVGFVMNSHEALEEHFV